MNAKLLAAAEQYGTPLYVYQAEKIIDQYQRFVNAFDVDKLVIHYAVKALSNINILKLFHSQGAGLDCVSIEEVKLGLEAGFRPEQIIFTPNGVAVEEYITAMEWGTKITVDNITILEKLGAAYPNVSLFVRINPHIMAGGNHRISVGHIDSKFGISIHQLPIVHRLVKEYNIDVEGIHIHTGSDIIEAEIFENVARLILSIADQFDDIRSIDFGSGFKVKYKANDVYTKIEDIGNIFSKLFNAYCQEKKKDITLRFEPGKFLVSEAGYFLAKVNVIKQTTACTFASVNSGFNHLIRPMFYNAYHYIENISHVAGQPKLYSVVGNMCESDTFAEDRRIAEIREGDVLAFHNAGAYCFSMASQYNSRLRPAEVLLYEDNSYLIREREKFETLLQDQKLAKLPLWT